MVATELALHRQVEDLYIHHHGWLQGWLRRKLGNPFVAADLTQDTFLRLLNREEATALQEPRAFLTTVAKGVLVNWYRRQALEQAYLDALAVLPEALSPSEEERLVILETLHQVDTMLDALPSLAKRAFLLSQVEGLKYEDIAERIGVSLITVKRHMREAFRGCLALMA